MSNVATANNNLLKCKVVMLPTKGCSTLYIGNNGKIYNQSQIPFSGNQHLYLTSDREIKMDDWYIDNTNAVRKCIVDDKDYWARRTNYKKVEATTDASLGLPIIPQSFIGKYVSAQGKIDAVNIEMEFGYPDTPYTGSYIPKLREDGTITIHSIKDSWSREEVKELCRKVMIAELHSKFDINEWLEQNIGL